MPQFGRAGVYTTEQLTVAATNVSPTGPSVAGFIGEHWRGPVGAAVLCNNWADFARFFGGFNSAAAPVLANPYLPFAVYEFFANGGQSAYVARVVSSATPGTSASVILKDSAATPQNTLQLTAGRLGISGNPGTWGNQLYVSIVNRGGVGSGRFDLLLYYGGVSAQLLVETWIDLSMNPADPRYVLTVLNSTNSGSLWTVATNLNSATSPPSNAPAVVTGTQFGGGTDSADPSVADRTNAVTSGTSPFDSVPGVLNFNLPGETTTSIIDAAITYAQTRPYSFLVIDPPSGLTPAGAVSFFQSLAPISSYGAMYYPWLSAIDPSAPSLSATRLLPPGGFVLGQMASIDLTVGVWRAPAGTNTALNVVQAERTFSPSDLDTLNTNNVNALRTLANGSVVIWGARTMQTGYSSMYVPIRRTLNYIESSVKELLQTQVFGANDSVLWGTISATLNQFLAGLWGQGAFAGNNSAQGFFVVCDGTINTPQSISQGQVNAVIGVALNYPAEFISILITQVQSTGTASTSILP